MQVFLQIVAFSLQNDGSDLPVLTKGKRPENRTLATLVGVACSHHCASLIKPHFRVLLLADAAPQFIEN